MSQVETKKTSFFGRIKAIFSKKEVVATATTVEVATETTETRVCPKCKTKRDVSLFNDPGLKTGVGKICMPCKEK